MQPAGRSQALEHTWAVGIHCGCPSPASWRSGREGRAEAEDLEVEDLEAAEADLDLTAGGRVLRRSQTCRHDVPCADARRLERTTAGRQQVALGWWECAAGGWNRPSRTYSRAPGWHGPNGCAGCTGDTLALPGRHAGAVAAPGGSAALAVRQTEGMVAGWEAGLWQGLAAAEVQRSAVAVAVAVGDVAAGVVAAGVVAAAEGGGAAGAAVAVAVAAVGQAAAAVEEAAADGMQGGGAIENSKAVADGGHQAAVGRKVLI
jgi:hypothetical protein